MSDNPQMRRGLNSLVTGKGCLLVFVVLVVLCSGLGVGGYKLMGWMERSTEASERAENPKDPRWAEVGTCVVDLGEASFTVGQGVFMGDLCLATGETVHVHHRKGEKVPLSEELRAVLTAEQPA